MNRTVADPGTTPFQQRIPRRARWIPRSCSRAKLMEFFSSQPRCLDALEVCGGTHDWHARYSSGAAFSAPCR